MAMMAALLAAWLPVSALAAVRASIEPRVIDELETARLVIRHTGTNQAARLDLSALETDFEVLTTQSSSQYRSVNGQVEAWVEYQVMLRPRRAGDLTIPPVEVDGETTSPLTLRVRGIEPELRDAIDRMVFFETDLTANPVYVQSETVMIRRLYYSSGAQIYSDLPGMPEIEDAVVTPLGETTSSTTILDGQRYGVIEQRFAILPEQSGTLTIPAISVTSSVRLESGGRTRRSGVRIATDPLELDVLPIPAAYPADAPWLPAEDVTLTDQWSTDASRIEVGDPLRRTITARVAGNVSSVIPPVDPAFPDSHFRRYPEPPELENHTGGDSVGGTRTQTYAMIPTAPGTVTLPPTELTWWDVSSHRVRTARAPGRTLTITGAPAAAPDAGAQAQAAQPADDRAPPPAPQSSAEIRSASDGGARDDPANGGPTTGVLRAALLIVLLAAAAALGGWLWRRRAESGRAAAEPSEREHWQALRTAAAGGDLAAVHRALLAFLKKHFHASTPEAVERFRAAGYGDVLDRLTANLYHARQPAGAAGAARVSADEVVAAARTLRQRRQRRQRHTLPGLYD